MHYLLCSYRWAGYYYSSTDSFTNFSPAPTNRIGMKCFHSPAITCHKWWLYNTLLGSVSSIFFFIVVNYLANQVQLNRFLQAVSTSLLCPSDILFLSPIVTSHLVNILLWLLWTFFSFFFPLQGSGLCPLSTFQTHWHATTICFPSKLQTIALNRMYVNIWNTVMLWHTHNIYIHFLPQRAGISLGKLEKESSWGKGSRASGSC